MTSIILAGGDGIRMRPLTCSMPKSMLPVCNIPLLEYSLMQLRRHNIKNVIIAADRFSNIISDHIDREREDLPVLSLKKVPEGTSMALETAAKEWDIPDEDNILVINGSALTDFDLTEIMRSQKYSRAAMTVVLKRSDRPYEGIAASCENGKLQSVSNFQPKESLETNLILTGIFVIRASLAKRISSYGSDILASALPALLKEGMEVRTITEEGYFLPIRTPEDLLTANADVLNGVYGSAPASVFAEASAYPMSEIESPVCIGENSDISPEAFIGERAVIGKNVTVGKGTKILGGVICDGVYIGDKCTVNHAVIGRSVIISGGASVFEGAVIGENALIAESAAVNPGVKIWNGRHVEPFACAAADLKYGFAKPVVIDDEGITGGTNGTVTPQTASVIGSAAASLGKRAVVGYRGTNAAKAIAMALSSGVMSSGGEVWFIGEATEPELAFSVRTCSSSVGCYIDAGITAKIKFFSSDGLTLTRREEKIIEGGINRGEYRRSGFSHFGGFKNCPDIKELYFGSLARLKPEFLNGIHAAVNTSEKHIGGICRALLDDVNDKNGTDLIFHINGDGVKLSAYTEETGYVFHDKLAMLVCMKFFEEGKDVALPYNFPSAAEKLAAPYGRKVYRYSGCSADDPDRTARHLASENTFVTDGTELMLRVLSILSEKRITLKEACAQLPEFAEVNRFVALDPKRLRHMNILKKLCSGAQVNSEGAVINDKNGKIMIRPVKTGKGLMMHVESLNLETASELCDFYQDRIKNINNFD